MRSYDSWVTEGDWHKCNTCGERYCDADGGCSECTQCSSCNDWVIDSDIGDDGLCEECRLYCYRCGREEPPVEFQDFMYCPVCYGVLLGIDE